MKKIYLAGPDVFKEDAIEYGKQLKKICLEYGFEGLFPLDSEIISEGLRPKELAYKIQKANIELIRKCDGVVANLSLFRGCEPDSGTVWEVGYSMGLGKEVVGYAQDLRSLKDKTVEILHLKENSLRDQENLLIEDFGLPYNLMFADKVCCKNFEQAIEKIKKLI
jgi:nucleoside 2-deoxyribosyltransferase